MSTRIDLIVPSELEGHVTGIIARMGVYTCSPRMRIDGCPYGPLARLTYVLPLDENLFTFVLRLLAMVNLASLRAQNLPTLREAGIRYQAERGVEEWHCLTSLLWFGHGDCDDLAPARLAEMWNAGDRGADIALVRTQISPKRSYHVVCLDGTGRVDDPSIACGMKVSTPYYQTGL